MLTEEQLNAITTMVISFKLGPDLYNFYLSKTVNETFTSTEDMINYIIEHDDTDVVNILRELYSTCNDARKTIINKGIQKGDKGILKLLGDLSTDILGILNRLDGLKVESIEPEHTEAEEDEAIIKQADEILTNGNPIKFLMDTFAQFHVGDYDTGLSMFLVEADQSIRNSQGLQPGVTGGTGSGKSSGVIAALHLTPQERVKSTSISAKALYFMNLKAGDIIFYDDIELSGDLRQTFKRMTSNFQDTTPHNLTTKDPKTGEYKTIEYKIPPRIVVIMTSVENDSDEQILNRQLFVATDSGDEHHQKIIDYKKGLFNRARPQYVVTEDVRVCRQIMRVIKSSLFKVESPTSLTERLVWCDLDHIRNYEKFEDVVKSFAMLRFKQRHVIREEEEDGQKISVIEATEDDFLKAIEIYTRRAENQTTCEDAVNLKILRFIGSHNGDYVFIDDIAQYVDLGVEAVRRRLHGYNGSKGLLYRVSGIEAHQIVDPNEGKQGRPKSAYRANSNFSIMNNYASVVMLKPVAAASSQSEKQSVVMAEPKKPRSAEVKLQDSQDYSAYRLNKEKEVQEKKDVIAIGDNSFSNGMSSSDFRAEKPKSLTASGNDLGSTSAQASPIEPKTPQHSEAISAEFDYNRPQTEGNSGNEAGENVDDIIPYDDRLITVGLGMKRKKSAYEMIVSVIRELVEVTWSRDRVKGAYIGDIINRISQSELSPDMVKSMLANNSAFVEVEDHPGYYNIRGA